MEPGTSANAYEHLQAQQDHPVTGPAISTNAYEHLQAQQDHPVTEPAISTNAYEHLKPQQDHPYAPIEPSTNDPLQYEPNTQYLHITASLFAGTGTNNYDPLNNNNDDDDDDARPTPQLPDQVRLNGQENYHHGTPQTDSISAVPYSPCKVPSHQPTGPVGDSQSTVNFPYPPPPGTVVYCYQYSTGRGNEHRLEQKQWVVVVQSEHPQPAPSYIGHVTLSCCVFWLCGFLFGCIGYILAVVAQGRVHYSKGSARRLGRASIAMSIIGIIAGITVAVTVGCVVGLSDSWRRQYYGY